MTAPPAPAAGAPLSATLFCSLHFDLYLVTTTHFSPPSPAASVLAVLSETPFLGLLLLLQLKRRLTRSFGLKFVTRTCHMYNDDLALEFMRGPPRVYPSFRNCTDLLSSMLFGFKIYGLEVPL